MELLVIILLILLTAVGLVAYFLVLDVFFSLRTELVKGIITNRRARSFWIGLINFAFFSVVGMTVLAIAQNNGIDLLNIVAFLIFLPVLIGISIGFVAIIQLVGSNYWKAKSDLLQISYGTVAILLAVNVPVLGWLLLLPYLAFVGFGGFILSLFERSKKGTAKKTEDMEK